MAAIFGLIDTNTFATERFKSIRRSVFYQYPNGAAPLTGLLSLMEEQTASDPEFQWYEKRLTDQRGITVAGNAGGPFLTTGNADQTAGGWTSAINSTVRITVGTADITTRTMFRVGHVVKVPTRLAGPIPGPDLIGIITAFGDNGGGGTKNYIDVKLSRAVPATTLNNATDVGVEVWVIGSSYAQGIADITQPIYNLPVPILNYLQIFKTSLTITGTALKTAAKFDETGIYRDRAKESSVLHMIEMEKAFIFAVRNLDLTGATPQYTMGGILWLLGQWESGSVANGGAYDLRTGSAATLDTDDNKRIIANSTGLLSEKAYDSYLERVFRVTNNTANEKLVLCGSGFLNVINRLYKGKSVLNTSLPSENAYGMNVVQHKTPFGDIYYKSHPLFSQNPTLRNNALILDVPNLKYRYIAGRDTQLLKNRQPNDADYRKDEYLTECGLELRFFESHMYLQNVQDYVA